MADRKVMHVHPRGHGREIALSGEAEAGERNGESTARGDSGTECRNRRAETAVLRIKM
jgi:hypothetical protein